MRSPVDVYRLFDLLNDVLVEVVTYEGLRHVGCVEEVTSLSVRLLVGPDTRVCEVIPLMQVKQVIVDMD